MLGTTTVRKNMIKFATGFISILFSVSLCLAGPNSNAVIHVNFRQDTLSIDSIKSCKIADTIMAAIQVTNAVNLFSYEIHVGFDTSHLQFLTGKKETGAQKNILETKDGSTFFYCSYSKKDSTKIIAGASILGDDELLCPAGSGFLGFLYFKKKTEDTTVIRIYSSLLETYSVIADTMVKSVNGVIFPGSSAIRKHKTINPHFSIQKNGDIVTIYSPESVLKSIQLFTVDGRCLTKIAGTTRKTSIALPSVVGNGPCIVRVLSGNNHSSSLMINNR
jgi:hypothetical protein